MRFWLSRHSEVTIREQLVTQVVLGILSGDLQPGARLPSTREMARRFRVHANTISTAYRELERERWLEFRHGSGVYIRHGRPHVAASSDLALDQLIANIFSAAREMGTPLAAVRSRLRQLLALQPPDHFLLIEPDGELGRIVTAEMQGAVTLPVVIAGFEACSAPEKLIGAIPVALPTKVEKVRRALPAGTECLKLSLRSVPTSLAPWLPVRTDVLVGVASRWPGFLKSARTMLIAAGFDPDCLIVRDARRAGWEKRLHGAAAVVCDSLTAGSLPSKLRAISFPLLSESSLTSLRDHQRFICAPLEIRM